MEKSDKKTHTNFEYLPEVNAAHSAYSRDLLEYRKSKNRMKKSFKKYKRLQSSYAFIEKLTIPRQKGATQSDDIKYEWLVYDLFYSLGYKCKKPKIDNDFDVIISLGVHKFGIEVKNGKVNGCGCFDGNFGSDFLFFLCHNFRC